MRKTLLRIAVLGSAFAIGGCSSTTNNPGGSTDAGGSPGSGTSATGGGSAVGTSSGGNAPGNGGAATSTSGGSSVTSSSTSSGGSTSSTSTGGSTSSTTSTSAGGSTNTSSTSTTKGGSTTTAAGGSTTTVGGSTTSGGKSGSTGGTNAGGKAGVGGASAGGTSAASVGGTTAVGVGGASGSGNTSGITVKLDATHQTIQGFGVNTALASGTVPVATMFSTTGADGIGLSILRVGMNTDGTLTGSGISEAKAAGGKIIGSCWSAPANCKSNNSTKDGGSLLTSCYDSWSTKIADFAKAQGLYAMSIANESDFASCPGVPVCTDSYETMTYTGKQMAAFVKIAGPKLKANGIKVIAPEASEWIHAWSNISGTGSIVSSYPNSSDPHKCGCFGNEITAAKEATCAQKCLDGDGYDYGHWLWKDQEAWKAFDILGVHEYDSQIAFPWPADVSDGKRDKEVWQTEMSGVMHWPEQGPSKTIENGIAVAGWIHSALTVGEASAWLYWWYQALYQDDNEGLALLKSDTASSTKAKRYYTLGNYSKFVRPGYIAVEVAGSSDANVLLSAYKSADGKTIAIVAINKGSAAASPKIGFSGGTAPASCTPTVTSAADNLKDGTAVTVTDGVLTAALASKTVTTYVCK